MKLTHEQVEKLEADAEKATKEGPFDAQGNTHVFVEADTILTLCREWRERGEALEKMERLADDCANSASNKQIVGEDGAAAFGACEAQIRVALKGADHE